MRIGEDEIEEYNIIIDKERYIEELAWEVIYRKIKLTEEDLGGFYKEVKVKVEEIQLETINKAVKHIANGVGNLGASMTGMLGA